MADPVTPLKLNSNNHNFAWPSRLFPALLPSTTKVGVELRSSRALSTASACSDEGPSSLTHVNADGKATMVDVGDKATSRRTAVASAMVMLGDKAFKLVAANDLKKGDVLSVAELAGIMGAKHTATLIPLCHNIVIDKVAVHLKMVPEQQAVKIKATASTVGRTGVEMEALTAASVASLTVYDMCKAVSHEIRITDLQLESKTGGKQDYLLRQ
eukprot:gene6743-23364_t